MASVNPSNTYLFSRRELGLLIEIYFPKRVLYQSEIIDALSEGVDGEKVKGYLKRNIRELLSELAEYPFVLDPQKYGKRHRVDPTQITMEDAQRRMEMYKSPFFGWSSYNVEGAFLNTNKKGKFIDDELTQVVRIIFRFESKYLKNAKKKGCEHILRSIAFWLMNNYYHRMPLPPWSGTERERFVSEQNPLSIKELEYIQAHYIEIARETIKWFDDTILFCFGYLVRRFWNHVIEVGRREDQIWVTSLFNLGINVVQPSIRPNHMVK
ncbi:MAG: hypothetical protein A3C06_00670 [Candidatus Taylorbacteria bacterium RIFCSPHIGHO2_02_FULL_46_13]|uniref:Uncharacterized protein n=2 Tax=Parcubacteria group TaxID=1794811 RepID=A0A1G2HSS5_9BACT|nr:MAG: hypothetical protein A2822_03630 [Candidatus Staskawiczbacteria bacterium RIFCSPHIGHO2_01_FULL_41_41]OGZ75036.1 MAG: hypothetical protein A3A12_04410 [Candidatus Staskawiczbacteria bacterium RIFCSPLOWO2_01_FULL_43_17b]OHA26053.1 MAG: hypothetical protein A3C06_00670 [Candidatus Taylorbacteria bacterium RIFCSPHIGHO2_02_FULL_46_13]